MEMLMKKFVNILFLFLSIVPFISAQEGVDIWTTTSTTIGRVYGMAIDQSNQSIMYACGLDQGVNKTTNGGVNWAQMNTGLLNIQILSIAICKNTPQVLYAGTNFGANEGVYKTTNGGTSWTQVNTGIAEPSGGIGVQSVMVHPDNPNIAYIAVFNGTADAVNGLYKTTDGGANWFTITNGIGTIKNFLSLAMSPTDPNTIYAGSSFQVATSTGPSAIYKSTEEVQTGFILSGLPTDPTELITVKTCKSARKSNVVVLAYL
jgi:photosystem II stability/assembly factor-like uncharacterized protein